MTVAYAIHRLSGVVSYANAAYTAAELEFQLKNSGAKALFTASCTYSFEIIVLIFTVCSPNTNRS